MFDPTLSHSESSNLLSTLTPFDSKFSINDYFQLSPLMKSYNSHHSSLSGENYDLNKLEEMALAISRESQRQSFFINASTSDAGNTLNTAKAITVTSTPTTYSDWVGSTDTNDYYRFSLTQSSQFNLGLTGLTNDADVRLLDNNGTLLIESRNWGTSSESINAQLLTGTYYLQVYPKYSNANTNYHLSVSATSVNDAGNTLNTAKDITLTSTPTTYSDWVGSTDTNDYYRFSVTQSSQFNLGLTGLTNDADVRLLDSNGTLLIESRNWGITNEAIHVAQLSSGTYYIQVYPKYSNSNTNYNLSISATPINEAGNSLNTAKVVTLTSTPTTYSDWLGNTDTNDYYRFSLTQASDFNVSLTGLSNNADIQLLDSSGNKLIESLKSGTTNESITAQLLTGTYYLRVFPVTTTANTTYNLTVSATAVNDAGNTLTTAKQITVGSTSTTYSDWVGITDTNDYYRFSLTQTANLDLSLTGLSSNTDFQLLDSNGNKLSESLKTGTNNDSINTQLSAGTYYIRVFPNSSNDNTLYTLNVRTYEIPAGYSNINGFGLVNAAASVAKAIGQTPFADVPDLGGNDWGADLVKAPEVWTKCGRCGSLNVKCQSLFNRKPSAFSSDFYLC